MIRKAPRLCFSIIVTGIALGLFAAMPARAQVLLDKSIQDPEKSPVNRPRRPPATTLSPLANAPWPRLDVGSLVCRTRDDLEAHSHAVAARLDGEPSATSGSIDCKIVNVMTAIEVVSRASPGATEVRLKGETATEWTDTWLPPRQPK